MVAYAEKNRSSSWLVICATMLLTLLSLAPAQATLSEARDAAEELRETWGIEITSIRLAAGGHMVDFRYRVLDAQKAATLFKRNNKPYLTDQESKKVLAVPNMGKVGPLRTSDPPKEGRIYWMFFGNSSGLVKVGSKISVTIGEFQVEDLVVQ